MPENAIPATRRTNDVLWEAPDLFGLHRVEPDVEELLSRHLRSLHERLEALSSDYSGLVQTPPAMARRLTHTEFVPTDDTLEAKLFDARTKLKMETAPLSMHLGGEWRQSIFRQIDRLYAVENWDSDSDLPSTASYKSFLRFIIHEDVAPLPAIGIGPGGNLLASYFSRQATVSFEFFANDRCRLVLHRVRPAGEEAVGRDGPTQGTLSFLTSIGISLIDWPNDKSSG